ncbi:MAG TPA: glycosyl hydrolase 115 family protein, partial [Verrucomicrobiae bacterium]|nr:glycosyl hydrolase 115 family protein [Verrucomicrobiae bacterium]
MKSVASWIAALLLPCSGFAACDILTAPSAAPECVTLAGSQGEATIVTDTNDAAVVQLAANFFADDVQRVTGHRPAVANTPAKAASVILAGTLGHSAVIDRLAASGKLADLDKIRGRWEATLWEIVDHPLPGVDRALVIVGSDRRGTAYGFMQLSEKIGVSPWYWWADVPPQHHETLAARVPSPQVDMPGVKYRGFFINDEDWGLNPWASKTFDPKFGNIGPKTYEKVFELMLRLRLNYLWPAMHACSTEFGATPENYLLADKFAIVAGSSHCEPMLCNNVHWNEKEKGPWNYSLNRDTIHSYWEDNVKARSAEEAVWTLGIRGIHDRSMETPPRALPDKIKLVDQVIQDQRELLDRYVATNWGPVAQCFVPYKEVLPIYDAGLKVPDDVTLVWVDDNFGYLRRLSNPAERQRSGGAGVYWHISYYGGPHSYTWIDTTAPALIW